MRTHYSTLQRIYNILVEPDPGITGNRNRQLASQLSAFLLAVSPFATLTILFGDLLSNIEPLILVVNLLIFSIYLMSRTHYYKITLVITLSLITFLPIVIWFSVTDWAPQDISRLMPWIIVALGAGALFADERVILIQTTIISSIMIFFVSFIRSIPFSEYDSHLLSIVILSALVIFATRMIDSYVIEVKNQSAELETQKRELEIYTRLLRHDLSNDLQAIINSVELSKLLLSVNTEKVDENLDQSLNMGVRMQKLLHVFKLAIEQPSVNLIENIQKVAFESERAHGNLSIEVSWSNEAEREKIIPSRLLPLVWTNIFRNASQHAGDYPVVHVNISVDDHHYHIVITDNGPGIPPEKRETLFKKAPDSEHQDKGIGLYLSKVIIESHGGTIELSDTPETQFIIRLPTSSDYENSGPV
ncbi:MAG: sensor histidine kinase [Candidatus Thorarchaeota archaeon]